MKFVTISDTHGKHRELRLPEGDVIIHAGDFCHFGSDADLRDFLDWYQKLDYTRKILTNSKLVGCRFSLVCFKEKTSC